MVRTMQGSNPIPREGRTVYTGTPRRNTAGNKCVCNCLLGVVLVALPCVLYYFENFQHQQELAFQEIEESVVEIDTSRETAYPTTTGTPVHFSSEYTGSTSDYDFGVTVDHALRLNRETQYCQWQEVATENCDTCKDSEGESYDCHCTTTYYYQKGWRNHLIFSAAFDQPFNHNNPLRDPYPSRALASENAIAGAMGMEPALLLNLRGSDRTVQYLHEGEPPPSYSFWKFFGWKDNQRYESILNLQPLMQSPAFVEHGFTYTGEEGWFFSPYEAGLASELVKKMGQYMEGTLLDWQISDLFGGCTAGDIRVRYKVMDPREVSVVGKYTPDPTPRVGIIDNLKHSSVTVGLAHAGAHSFEGMVDAENAIANRNTWIARVALVVVWPLCAMGAKAFRSWISALGCSLLLVSLCWATVYGLFDFAGVTTSLATLLLMAGSALLLVAGQLTVPKNKNY